MGRGDALEAPWALHLPRLRGPSVAATLTSLPAVFPFHVLITSSKRSTSKTQT